MITRILVTGSRTWRDGALVRQKLDEVLADIILGAAYQPGTMTVVHGACRSGPDKMADEWARWHHANHRPVNPPEPHPAQWEAPCRDTCRPGHRRADPRGWDVCPTSGFYRNEHMVRLGADLCLAFINDESKGATHCADYAEEQGIPVRRYRTTTNSPSPTLF